MKKHVGIIYSGQLRGNSLNKNFTKDDKVLEATNKFLFNEEFKKNFTYDVFFSVDDTIDIDKAKDFFGENLKNIHITENDWYMNSIDDTIPSFSYYYEKYCQIDFKGFADHKNEIYQYYRMYCCYNMLKNYQKKNNITYDYLVRIRPDILLMQDTMQIFNLLENSNKQIFIEHEQLCIIKYELEDIFRLIEFCGKYNKPIKDKMSIYLYLSAGLDEPSSEYIYRFCPEYQFVEHIYYTLKKKNYDFFKTFIGIQYPSYNLLYRENGSYGYLDENHTVYNNSNFNEMYSKIDFKWIPRHDIKYILEKMDTDLEKYKNDYPIIDDDNNSL
jgi:hypothetical protein